VRRPAVVVFGVLVACWTGHEAPPAQPLIANHSTASPGLTGEYWCTITEGDYKYPRFPCAIRDDSGHLLLAKLAGSVRFEGEIRPARDGFSFHGRMFCPWGDCTQDLNGTFAPDGGRYVGTFRDDQMVVDLERAPAGAFGGDTYGGAGYGGATYGNYAPTGRRNRHR
jgi:hypothetical protein